MRFRVSRLKQPREGGPIATYRAYRVDSKRHIQNGTWLEAANDAEAQASELCAKGAPVIELWQSTRLVDEIECADAGDS